MSHTFKDRKDIKETIAPYDLKHQFFKPSSPIATRINLENARKPENIILARLKGIFGK